MRTFRLVRTSYSCEAESDELGGVTDAAQTRNATDVLWQGEAEVDPDQEFFLARHIDLRSDDWSCCSNGPSSTDQEYRYSVQERLGGAWTFCAAVASTPPTCDHEA